MQVAGIDVDQPSPVDVLRSELVSAAGLDDIAEPEWLISKILMQNSLAWFYGPPGCGKSFVALDWACCVSVGTPWHDWSVAGGPVIYVAGEGVAGMRKRVRAWEAANGCSSAVAFMPRAMLVSHASFDIFTELCAQEKAKLVVLDTQARMTVGMEENSSHDMGLVVAKLDALRRATDGCVLLVHHSGWEEGHARGSSAIQGGMDTVIRASRADGDDEVSLHNEKQKDASEFADVTLRMVERDDSLILAYAPEAILSVAEITRKTLRLRTLWARLFRDDWVTSTQLDEAKVCSRRTFATYKWAMVDAGLIDRSGSGNQTRYQLASRYAPESPLPRW